MSVFHLEIAAPDGKMYDGDAYMLALRGIDGELAILPGHIPFVTALAPGAVRVYTAKDAAPRVGHASGGCLTVSPRGTRLLAADFTWDGSPHADDGQRP